jgi:uncharacterized protein
VPGGVEAEAQPFAPDLRVVQGYRPGGFTVSGVRHQGSVLVFPDRVLPWSGEVDAAGLEAVRAALPVPDILVVGTGSGFVPVPPALRQAVRAWGPVVEAMATPAACRTYNVLLAEGRRVAAALVALPPAA